MKSKKISQRHPTDAVAAWSEAAHKAGLTLSEWVYAQCNRALPRTKQRKLGPRPTAGGDRRSKSADNARR